MKIHHVSALIAVLLVSPLGADVVVLNDGKRLEGVLLKQNDTTLWLDIGPMVIELDNNDVKEVEENKNWR